MGKLLLLIVLALVVWQIARRVLAPPPAGGGEPAQFEPTARCGKCGTHVPKAQLDAAGLCPRCRAQAP